MWKMIFVFLLAAGSVYSQSQIIGKMDHYTIENGVAVRQTVLNPMINEKGHGNGPFVPNHQPVNVFNNTTVKWVYTDPASIGDFSLVSGNGKYEFTSWNLNNSRFSVYNNSSGTPLWEFFADPMSFLGFISISDTGGVLAAGSYKNIYLFSNSGSTPTFNFDLTVQGDTDVASPLSLTKDGKFLVASSSGQDSARIYGFNAASNIPVWTFHVVPAIAVGGPGIQGMKISANDSIIIANTYAEFFVLKTYTGELIFRGLVNNASPSSGTQTAQGISGDGSIIATINYSGVVTVYQRNGNNYTVQWANQEPPGTFYNWYTGVDISDDGNFIAAGTLNFLSSSEFDGKVKVFSRTAGSAPMWTYAGCGDEVSAVSFSGSGNILAASSWGDFNHTTEDLYIFKTFMGNTPIFKLNTSGSLFYCNTSNDGQVVIASGKAVHARTLGSGGLLYNIAVDTNDIPIVSIDPVNGVAAGYELYQNYPNPFNPATTITYDIQHTGNVSLKVFDMTGREVSQLVNSVKNPGKYNVTFNGEGLSSGVYYYKLTAGNFSSVKKLILLK